MERFARAASVINGLISSDKAVHKPGILTVAGFDLQPLSEFLKALFDVQQFTDQRANGKAGDDQKPVTAGDTAAVNREHALQRTADADK